MKIRSLFITSIACSHLLACAVSPTIGYTKEPSKIEDKIGAQTINFEVLLVTSERKPLESYQITAKTSQNEGMGITNDKGVTRIFVDRKESEPILFTFKRETWNSVLV